MTHPTPKMRNFSERLISHEAKGNKSREATIQLASVFDERLRPHLTALLGVVGFRALLLRALVLATPEFSWLRAVRVKRDGSLEGLDEFKAHLDPDDFLEGCVVLLAQFLGLLVTFIGEDLTLRLVREGWPKLPLKEFDFRKGDEK